MPLDPVTIQLIIGILTLAGSIVVTLGTMRISMWVNKRKVPVEVDKDIAETEKERAETKLVEGGLAEKYHSLATLQAGENIELTNQNMVLKKQMEDQSIVHQKQIDELRTQMLDIDRKHVQKENELEEKLETEIKLRLTAEDYIRRLLYQFKSWDIVPVPYDVTQAKEQIKQTCIEGNTFIGEQT